MAKPKFLKVKTLKEAKKLEPNYKVFVKVSGGYMAYLNNQDFIITFNSLKPQSEYIV